ncbi:site-specific integrase [Fibrisoma montanum]|uniref:Site-specific integrase n=1 Tax=Fibrisoma montanum TaxID=2305895 RepID=A0A418MB95_9BACT|nr:site-specific integrase [Fibrisoma montanum]RIV23652.1 site-specific integrase [Fibrisoma montanum]
MTPAITLYLREDRLGDDGTAPIHLRVCWQGRKVRTATGERIAPLFWDSDEERIRRTAPGAKNANRRLSKYRDELEQFFEQAPLLPTEDQVRAEIKRIQVEVLGRAKRIVSAPEPPAAPTYPALSSFATQYVAERRADRSESWCESVGIVGDHLAAFRLGIDWPDLTINTLNLFKVYLQEELELSDATLHTYVSLLRGMLKYAIRSGCPVPPDYTWLETRLVGDTLRPTLTHGDLEAIRTATLRKPQPTYPKAFLQTMEETRWYFLMACYTGLRHSDLHQLMHPTLTTVGGLTCLEAIQQKTGKLVTVPLLDDALELLNGPVPRHPPEPRFNYTTYLQHIGQQAGLARTVLVGSYYKGKLITDDVALYLTLTSHTARRTFGSLMTQGGLPTKVLQDLLGHKTISSTQKYSKVPNHMIVSQSVAAWQQSKRGTADPTKSVGVKSR